MSIINSEAPAGVDFPNARQEVCPTCDSEDIEELGYDERHDVSLMGCNDCARRWTE